ncbi:MAG: Rieske 2Fe-2S domain-containing protein [Actinomycetota bacterium]
MSDTVQLDHLGDGEAMRIEVDLGDADGPTPIAIVRIGEAVHAIGDICSHANVSLSEGDVWCDELELECPKHSSAFSLLTGEPSTLPATQPVEVFDATVVDGRIEIARRSHGEGSGS